MELCAEMEISEKEEDKYFPSGVKPGQVEQLEDWIKCEMIPEAPGFSGKRADAKDAMDNSGTPDTGTIAVPEKWMKAVELLDFAFQPIVNSLSGATFAVEALVRGSGSAGFTSIADMFDAAYEEKVLYGFDLALRRKAIRKFSEIGFHPRIKLFYNYDPRVHEMADYRFGMTEAILGEQGLTNDMLCFELSEQHRIGPEKLFKDVMTRTRQRGFKIALDDFGAGFSSFELFYHSDPDFLKFDRFLIKGIDSDIKKRTFFSHILSLAKVLGVVAIAEGVETEKELLTCKELGCDLIQGYYVQRPTLTVDELLPAYAHVGNLEKRNFRKGDGNAVLVSREIVRMDTICIDDDMKMLFNRFNRNSDNTFFPVLDANGFPLGIIHERSIKRYVYSPFGFDLMRNKSVRASIESFIEKCPIVDINTPQDKILEVFVNNPDSDGVLITDDLRYVGFLNARSLLAILNEHNLALAREENPLTGLPGNHLINRFVADSLAAQDQHSYFIYYDLDNFKPFNDRFGFRQGDRVILLFAEILRQEYPGAFVGHIGGDDFFAGVLSALPALGDQTDRARKVIKRLEESVTGFFSADEIRAGMYRSAGRFGSEGLFPLLSASAAIVEVPKGNHRYQLDDLSINIAEAKSQAKNNPDRMSVRVLSSLYSPF